MQNPMNENQKTNNNGIPYIYNICQVGLKKFSKFVILYSFNS